MRSGRKVFRVAIAISLPCLVSVSHANGQPASDPGASLAATYRETGRLFTHFMPPYDSTKQIDGSITFAMPLAANITLQNFAPGFEASGGTYSFFDGIMNYNLANSSPANLIFATDSSAKITAWQVEIFSNAGPIILLQNIPSVPNSGFDKVLSGSAQQLALSDGPATWAVVPEPTVLTLSAVGLSVLAAATHSANGRSRTHRIHDASVAQPPRPSTTANIARAHDHG